MCVLFELLINVCVRSEGVWKTSMDWGEWLFMLFDTLDSMRTPASISRMLAGR